MMCARRVARSRFALSILAAACAPAPLPPVTVVTFEPAPTERLQYIVELTEVERPASAQQRYGPSHQATSDSAGTTRYAFEDSLIEVTFIPRTRDIAFRLANQSAHPIKLMWNEAAYVDISGRAQRVMHAGVRYSERGASMPPSVIPRGGYIDDVIQPAENVFNTAGGGWRSTELIPGDTYSSLVRDSVLAAKRRAVEGRELRVLLPIQIEGVVNDYTFTFRVSDVRGLPVE